MKRTRDPRRLDVAALAADAGECSGQWPGPSLARLAEAQNPPQDLPLDPVEWAARGELLRSEGRPDAVWLHLKASTRTWLTCQRCLQPMAVALAVDRPLRFVRDEAQAEALDAESEEDVLVLDRQLDLQELVEDELLLELPLVPRHEVCPQPLPMSAGEDELADAPADEHPFAALGALRRGGSGSDGA